MSSRHVCYEVCLLFKASVLSFMVCFSCFVVKLSCAGCVIVCYLDPCLADYVMSVNVMEDV